MPVSADSTPLPPPLPGSAPRSLFDGVLERHSIPGWILAVLALFVGFIGLQVVGGMGVVLWLAAEGVPVDEWGEVLRTLEGDALQRALMANTVGQVLGLGVPAWLFARGSSTRPGAVLRLGAPDGRSLGLAAVGLVAMQPLIQWLGALNERLPLPEAWTAMEEGQLEMIERVMSMELGLAFTLFTLALTPALCEELLFRGYAQRQLERSMGPLWGILACGLAFGAFHLRFSQLLPLAVLGCYLAYLTWRTGSLWPAVVVHLLNNGLMVLMGAYVSERDDLDLEAIETMTIPTVAVVTSLVVFGAVLYALHAGPRAAAEPSSPYHGPTD